jgi:hypothetical protein
MVRPPLPKNDHRHFDDANSEKPVADPFSWRKNGDVKGEAFAAVDLKDSNADTCVSSTEDGGMRDNRAHDDDGENKLYFLSSYTLKHEL